MAYVDGFVCPLSVQSWCFRTSLSISDWAAWVQAIGSVLAVFVAVGLVAYQLWHEQQRGVELETNRLHTIWRLVYHCRVEMTHVAVTTKAIRSYFGPQDGVEPKIAALKAVPILDIPNADAVHAVMTVVESYEAFRTGTQHPSDDASWCKRVESHANASQDNFEFAERQLRRCLVGRADKRVRDEPVYSLNGQRYPPLEP